MEYYVYIYLNPLKPGNFEYKKFNFEFEPFYIGLGKKNRINHHIIWSKYKEKYNLHKTVKEYTILKILKNNIEPIRFKLYENLTLYSAIRLEKYLIKLIGRRDLDKGSLANLTDGGEGTFGRVYTDIQLENRKILTNKLWCDGIYDNRDFNGDKNPFYNKHHTEETKNKIIIKIGDSQKGNKNSNYGKKWSEDAKRIASKRQIENHAHLTGENNPSKRKDVRKKISDGKLGEKNPNAKKWLLISPENEEFIINGGIKRKLKEFNLTYSMFEYYKDDEKRKTKNGWILKIF